MNTRRCKSRPSTLAALLCTLALPATSLACSVQPANARPTGAQERGATVTCPWTQAVMPTWFSSSQLEAWNRHLRLVGQRLRGHHERLVASGYARLTFEEFAYIDLMTMCTALHAHASAAAGTYQAQRRQILQAEYAGSDPGVCAAWGLTGRSPSAR